MRKYRIEFKYALIYVLMTIVWALIGKMLGFHDKLIGSNLWFNFLVIIPSFIVYYLALKQKKENYYSGEMNFKKGLASGIIMTVLVTIFGILTPIITATLISPNLFANSINYVVQAGMMTEAEARAQFNLSAFIIQGIFAAPIFGLVLSALAAFLLRSSKKQTIQYARN